MYTLRKTNNLTIHNIFLTTRHENQKNFFLKYRLTDLMGEFDNKIDIMGGYKFHSKFFYLP